MNVIFCAETGLALQFCSLFSEVRREEVKHLANPVLARGDGQRSSDQHNWRAIRHIERKSVGGSAVR